MMGTQWDERIWDVVREVGKGNRTRVSGEDIEAREWKVYIYRLV